MIIFMRANFLETFSHKNSDLILSNCISASVVK